MLPPVEVDPRRFCREAKSWEVSSDVSEFPRLAEEFMQGALSCRVDGQADRQGCMQLKLRIQGDVGLTCQRCLGTLVHRIDIDFVVHLARDETELERLDALPDGDAILAGASLDLAAVVEDEVLLSLPLVPMHAEGECAPRGVV